MAYSSKPTKIEDNIYRITNRDGSTSYSVRVIDRTGRWFPQKSFKTKREARSYRLMLFCERDAGTLAPCADKKRLTVADFWQMWAGERRTKISEGWKMSQDQMSRDHVLPYIGKLRLVNVAPKHIGDLMHILSNKGLSDQTQKHVYNMLSVAFKEAVEHYEFLEASPVKKRYRPDVGKKPQEALTPDEAITLAKFTKDHYLGPAVWLAVFAGLRVEAIHALRWSSINFKSNRILIVEAFKRKERRVVPYPKGKDLEFVVMPPVLVDFLKQLRVSKSARDSDFVAPGQKGGMIEYGILYKGVRKMCKKAGLPVVSPHLLRHSATEIYVRFGGATMEDIRRLLHHKSMETTKRYMHRTDERSYDLAIRMSEGVASLLRRGSCGGDHLTSDFASTYAKATVDKSQNPRGDDQPSPRLRLAGETKLRLV